MPRQLSILLSSLVIFGMIQMDCQLLAQSAKEITNSIGMKLVLIGLVDLIDFRGLKPSFPPDPRAAEYSDFLARLFGFGGTVDREELRCLRCRWRSSTPCLQSDELLEIECSHQPQPLA